jgi:hypothetical protein
LQNRYSEKARKSRFSRGNSVKRSENRIFRTFERLMAAACRLLAPSWRELSLAPEEREAEALSQPLPEPE